jgi:hypothetical protein
MLCFRPPSCKASATAGAAGPYVVQVRPTRGATVTARLHRSRDLAMKIEGDATPLRITEPGQVLRLAIPARAGDNLSVVLSDLRVDPPSGIGFHLKAPSGASTAGTIASGAAGGVIGPVRVGESGDASLSLDAGFSRLSATVKVTR